MINFHLPTAQKIRIARLLSRIITTLRKFVGLPPTVRAFRSGVQWHLDLREGIDLAIYLGVYEPETLKALTQLVHSGDVVLDIGGNIGAIALPVARMVGPSGQVIVFEPTVYACSKFRKNAALNPALEPQLRLEQTMLLATEQAAPKLVYSSWNLRTQSDELTHPKHQGRLMETDGAEGISLDAYFAKNPISQIDLIKLDVDGYELSVLQGARKTLSHYRPKIILEVCPHIQEEALQFAALLDELNALHYQLVDLVSGQFIPLDQKVLEQLCPPGGGINVLALPCAS